MSLSSPIVPADQDIGLLALVIANGFTEAVLQRLGQAGFADTKFTHGFVVQGLLAGDTTVTELAERLGISVQAVSKTVQEMESLGYIEKRRDAADRRSFSLHLTERAHASVEASRIARAEVQSSLFESLGGHREQFIDELRSLADHFGGLATLAERRLRPPL